MTDPLSGLTQEEQGKLQQKSMPDWTDPMLATLTHEYFSDPNWIYERKLDGERCLAFKQGDTVRLLSRNQKELNATYPELVKGLAGQSVKECIVDGEIVAFEGDVTSFSRLQARMQIKNEKEAQKSNVAVYFYLFDILFLNGHDVTALPLRTRKGLLQKAIAFDKPLRFTSHRNEDGEAYHEEACGKGWEGIIAKDAASSYLHSRSKKWLKFKCVHRQELVIGGWTDPHGERRGFGALLMGYYDGDDFVYAGKVGTGYDHETLERLSERMGSLSRKTSPFDRGNPSHKGVHWITPKLVAEVGFTEWTDDGKLRHPRYIGLRRDKQAKDVVRESG